MERDTRGALNLASAHLGILAQYGWVTTLNCNKPRPCMISKRMTTTTTTRVYLSWPRTCIGMVGCDIVQVTDALATVKEIAMGGTSSSGGPQQQPALFDLVFVDADKTRLLDCVEVYLRNDNVLKPGGHIVVDNVLWKGLVLEANVGDFLSLSLLSDLENEDPNSSSRSSGLEKELRKNRQAWRLATQMHAFNSAIVLDKQVESLLLQMRDGLSVIRKQ
jgi:predicted O-methyltransferase YrrM